MKKLLSLALISAMLLTFTACDKKENSSDTSTENSQSNQTSNSESSSSSSEPDSTNVYSIPVPEGGWTFETAAGVFCLEGKPIPIPFTIDAVIDKLGSDYRTFEYSAFISEEGISTTDLFHGDDRILRATYYNIKEFDEIPSAEAGGLDVSYKVGGELNKAARKLVTFNGIKLGATKDEVLATFGEPSEYVDETWYYFDAETGDNCFAFIFDVDGIMIYMGLDIKVDF